MRWWCCEPWCGQDKTTRIITFGDDNPRIIQDCIWNIGKHNRGSIPLYSPIMGHRYYPYYYEKC